jgi:hypothetical protein
VVEDGGGGFAGVDVEEDEGVKLVWHGVRERRPGVADPILTGVQLKPGGKRIRPAGPTAEDQQLIFVEKGTRRPHE